MFAGHSLLSSYCLAVYPCACPPAPLLLPRAASTLSTFNTGRGVRSFGRGKQNQNEKSYRTLEKILYSPDLLSKPGGSQADMHPSGFAGEGQTSGDTQRRGIADSDSRPQWQLGT